MEGEVMGLEKIPDYKTMYCMDSQHNPPMHIYIPAGYQYRHRCPSCGQETVITSPEVSCSVWQHNGPVPQQNLEIL